MQLFAIWVAVVTIVLVWQSTAYGEQEVVDKTETFTPPTRAVAVSKEILTQENLADFSGRITSIEMGISTISQRIAKTDHTPAILGLAGSFFGVLVGSVLAVVTQRKLLAHQKNLADTAAAHARYLADAKAAQDIALVNNRAKIEIGNYFAQWQLRQLSELYGPLHALFRQSSVVYRHMNVVLERVAPERFRLRSREDFDDFDKKVFEINLDGKWVLFRTIIHIGEVYGQSYGIDDYFDEVVSIGGRITAVISEKAGYTRPEQPELVSLFGNYLAHYSVLMRLHSQIKESLKASEQGNQLGSIVGVASAQVLAVDESAAFPRQIQHLVDDGFTALHADLNTWRTRAFS